VITQKEAESAKNEVITKEKNLLPRKAPHLVSYLLANTDPARWRWGQEGFWGLNTSLDIKIQDLLEMRLNQALLDFPASVTGAGALIDNQTGEVLAYVGGARTDGPWSFVDNARSLRSPGSALKPFIYLTAFAEFGLNPATMLADTPLSLDGQAPRNFDGAYRGPVSAGRALAESLNVPAVRVLRLIGQQNAQRTLRQAGFRTISGRNYGDSLILGGLEVTLIELLTAYSTLARGGELMQPVFERKTSGGDIVPAKKRVFDQGAVWLINESLKDDLRLPLGLRGSELAFKTGTSHGFRDAWMAVYNVDHSLVLWLGDPSGRSHEKLSGLSSLAPAAVTLMRSLGKSRPWPGPPDTLERFKACPLSGEPISVHCTAFTWSWRLASIAKTHPCRLHMRQKGQTVTLWPPELAGFMAAKDAKADQHRAEVVSPLEGGVIVLKQGQDRLPLRSEGTTGIVHWYLDDEFYEAAAPGSAPMLVLTPGSHRVSLVDEQNQTAKSDFIVVVSRRSVDPNASIPVIHFN
jgi:penicillin-binding protein 1C